ncbi:aldehyde dehydrogenase, partial [Burkholderia sp. Ax-1735]|nr:aldehyde dehydrogenase [Burkholderia sp. Ax-1735]
RSVNAGAGRGSGAGHTAETERGVRCARRTGSGRFDVNEVAGQDDLLGAPGGDGTPGIGRLNGEAAVDAFTTWRWMSIQHGRTPFPF